MLLKAKGELQMERKKQLQREVWRLRKRFRTPTPTENTVSEPPMQQEATNTPEPKLLADSTPSKTAASLMRDDGVSPSVAPKTAQTVRKYVTLIAELKSACHVKIKITRNLSGEFIRRGKLARALSDDIGVSRKAFHRPNTTTKSKQGSHKKALAKAFLMREDNATCLPGKRDAMKVGTQKLQKYKLLDHIHTLYKKYKIEFPKRKISLATFKKARTKNILPVKFNSRHMCLCTHHQNFKLMMLALKLKGSPDSYIENITVEKIDESLTDLPDNMQFEQWERVSVEYKEHTIKKMKLLRKEMPSDTFKEKFRLAIPKTQSHIARVPSMELCCG